MKLVVFGLSVSSSWGNGHAVLWRALIRALAAEGHLTVFFERDVPYYADNRDVRELAGGRAGPVRRLDGYPRRGAAANWPTPMRRSSPPIARTALRLPSWCSMLQGCMFFTISTRR